MPRVGNSILEELSIHTSTVCMLIKELARFFEPPVPHELKITEPWFGCNSQNAFDMPLQGMVENGFWDLLRQMYHWSFIADPVESRLSLPPKSVLFSEI